MLFFIITNLANTIEDYSPREIKLNLHPIPSDNYKANDGSFFDKKMAAIDPIINRVFQEDQYNHTQETLVQFFHDFQYIKVNQVIRIDY